MRRTLLLLPRRLAALEPHSAIVIHSSTHSTVCLVDCNKQQRLCVDGNAIKYYVIKLIVCLGSPS